MIGSSNRELKGEELSPNQLESFSYKVFPSVGCDSKLTVVGADTEITSKDIIERARQQVGEQFAHCATVVLEHNPSNKRLAQQYTEAAGWVRKRSAENFLWVNTLEEEILQSVQHGVVYFLEPQDDTEFENIEIIIDRSFIKREQHIGFWKEWLRNGLVNRSHRKEGFVTPDTWAKRDHPFRRKYGRNGLFDFNDLYQNHMRFDESGAVLGLQIADICAHTCYRYYRGERELKAYWNLRPRIVGRDGRPITLIQFTRDSLYSDGVENHVGILDIEDMKRKAAERRKKRKRQAGPLKPSL